jgi:hypothetical protein
VLVVHHSGKDQSKGARGSLALQGATDAVFALTRSGDALKLTNEKQKDGEEAPPITLDLARVSLSDGKTSRVVRSTNTGLIGMGTAFGEAPKDPRLVKTDIEVLGTLASFGHGGAALAQWRSAADCANDTFYKSRNRLVDARKVIHDAENARYISADLSAGPGPELVQDRSNSSRVQKVSPEVPPLGDSICWSG